MRNAQNNILSLEKGVDLLFLFVESATLGIREIAEHMSVPVSTAYRFVRTLRHRGLLEQDPFTRKYRLGLRLLALEASILRQLNVRTTALPHMHALAQHCEETVQLTLRWGSQAVCIEVVESPEPLRVAPPRGQALPLHTGALAKAILAFLPRADIDHYLKKHPLHRFTPDSITDPANLEKDLARIRKRGYAISTQEVYLGAGGVAAPIFDNNGQVIASLGVSGPLPRMTTGKIADIVPEILRRTEKISAELGRR